MARKYKYIVDNLTNEKADKIRKALETVPGVSEILVSVTESYVQVTANQQVDSHVKMACELAGASFRTAVKSRKFRR